MPTVRPPAVAGTFYPSRPAELRKDVAQMLAHPLGRAMTHLPKALIVPHAGYVYSGPIAASAYAQLAPLKGRIRRVVLLGPAHYVPLRGLALPETERFSTPLGEIPLDLDLMQQLEELPVVMRDAGAHAEEHSLEVQLPFLQQVLGDFTLVPLVIGEASAAEVADVLDMAWGGDETLIVISSDLSHYLPDARAREADDETVSRILALQALGHRQACGATPINGLLLAARRHGLRAIALDVRNSSQTAGDPDRVVGYGALAFIPDAEPPSASTKDETAPSDWDKGRILLQIARAAIGAALGRDISGDHHAPWLAESGATFVTLTQHGQLRGCIGSVESYRPLHEDVRDNAVSAALRDPRFRPLRAHEFDGVRIEVSLLSPLEELVVADEAAALASMRPHVDGVVFAYGQHRSVYLPQVWDQLPSPAEFLFHLREKAGLPGDFWAEGVRLWRFTVREWHERGL